MAHGLGAGREVLGQSRPRRGAIVGPVVHPSLPMSGRDVEREQREERVSDRAVATNPILDCFGRHALGLPRRREAGPTAGRRLGADERRAAGGRSRRQVPPRARDRSRHHRLRPHRHAARATCRRASGGRLHRRLRSRRRQCRKARAQVGGRSLAADNLAVIDGPTSTRSSCRPAKASTRAGAGGDRARQAGAGREADRAQAARTPTASSRRRRKPAAKCASATAAATRTAT